MGGEDAEPSQVYRRYRQLRGGARFVHVLRNGEDVVASIVDADMSQPTGAFPRRSQALGAALEIRDGRADGCLGDASHYGVCLEDMV